MTDETPNPTVPEPEPVPGRVPKPQLEPVPPPEPQPTAAANPAPSPAPDAVRVHRPEYRGAELDPERGPGLGCFWFQVAVLGFFIILIPIGINLAWPYEALAILLFIVIGLLLLTGQTVIFLLRLVAADRRAQGRRRPLASPTRTVGELEDAQGVAHAVGSAGPVPTESAAEAGGTEAELEPDTGADATGADTGDGPDAPTPEGSAAAADADPPAAPEDPDPGVRQ